MLERVWRKGNPPTMLVGLYVGVATVENSTEVPQKTNKWNHVIQQSSTTGYILDKLKFKRIYAP